MNIHQWLLLKYQDFEYGFTVYNGYVLVKLNTYYCGNFIWLVMATRQWGTFSL